MPNGLAKATTETPMPADTVGKSTGNHASITGSAQEQYYRFMLMKEKAAAKNDTNLPKYLRATSEVEDIEVGILEKLVKITESSPEFAQIVSLTGSEDRFEQARILAKHVYDKVQAEQILSFYTPEASVLRKNFYDKTLASAEERFQKVAKGAVDNGGTVSGTLAAGLARLLGGGAGAGAP
jgi:hypothetical protein